MTITLLTGSEMVAVLDELATLRLTIFAEYPYLYRGERADERAYLQGYAAVPDGCALLVRDGGKVVGAATGMPLVHEDGKLRAAVAGGGTPAEECYYVGELLFFSGYRRRGLGQQLLAQLADHLGGRYRNLTCATVEHPVDHPQRPTDYIPITRFLARTGFVRLEGCTTCLAWRETDGVVRDHAMQLWLKRLAV